jgi:hypothetical protein
VLGLAECLGVDLSIGCRRSPGVAGPGVSDLIGALRCTMSVLSCDWDRRDEPISLEENLMAQSKEGREVILGVDTHLDAHVAVVIDGVGKVLGTLIAPVGLLGYQQLLQWSRSFGACTRAGVEGTGTYGAGLARAMPTSKFWKSIGRIGRSDVSEGSPPRRMPRMPRAPYYRARPRRSRSCSRA